MRIVGGRWAGHPLISPGERIRPTSEALRGRWLATLGSELEGARVLDLFAGTGALGLEALSRGASRVDFVEWSPAALHALKGNVAALKARDRTRIFRKDVFAFLGGVTAEHDEQEGVSAEHDDQDQTPPYNLILADPPYTSTLAARLARVWLARDQLHRPLSRILSVEHPVGAELPPGGSTWVLDGSAVTNWRADAS